MEESETLISEREIPQLLAEYQIVAVNSILNNQLDQGLEILSRSQELIEAAISQDALVSPELIILIQHTLSLYYHYTGDVQNEINSLQKTLSLFKNYVKSLPSTLIVKPSHRIFKARILLKLHFQLLDAHCKAEHFPEALKNAKSALRRSQNIVHSSLKACQEHIHRHKLISSSPVTYNQGKNQQYVLLESPHYQLFHSLVSKAMPILLFLDEKSHSISKFPYAIPSITLEDITNIQPWSYETLIKGPEIMEELESDLMMEKIVVHIACHFFLGNLLKKNKNDELQIESDIMIKRAWRICSQFLKEDHPIYLAVCKGRKKGKSPIRRIRSGSRIKTPAKVMKTEPRSFSSNKFKASPFRKLNESCRDLSHKHDSGKYSKLRKTKGK